MGDSSIIRELAKSRPDALLRAVLIDPRHGPFALKVCPNFLSDPTIRNQITAAVVVKSDPHLVLELALLPGADVPALQRAYLELFKAEPHRRTLFQSFEFMQRVPSADPAMHLEAYKILSEDLLEKLLVTPKSPWAHPPAPLADKATLAEGAFHLLSKQSGRLRKVLETGFISIQELEDRAFRDQPSVNSLDALIHFAIVFKDQFTRLRDLDEVVDSIGTEVQKRRFATVFPDTWVQDGFLVREIMDR